MEWGEYQMNKVRQYIYTNKTVLLCFVLIVIFTFPTLITCLYIMPSADDFSNACRMLEWMQKYNESYLLTAIARTVDLYKNTSGYFFAAFLNLFLNPFLRGGVWAVRICCLVFNLFLYISLFYFTYTLMKFFKIFYNKKDVLPIYVLLLFCFTNINLNGEASFWYTTLVAYVFVLVIMLWGLIAFVKALESKKISWLIIAAIIGFLSSGASLNITALNCFGYLVVAIYGFFALKEKKYCLICFGSVFMGAILNVVSPGNYIRHDSVVESYDVTTAIFTSFEVSGNRLYWQLTSTLLPYILAFLFIYVLVKGKKIQVMQWLNPILLVLVTFFSLAVILFPVVFGYATNIISERCLFVQDFSMYILSFVIIIYSAEWLKNKYEQFQIRKEFIVILVVVSGLMLSNWHSGKIIENVYPSYHLTKQIVNGENRKFMKYWSEVFDEIKNSDEENVMVCRGEFSTTSELESPGVEEDENYWINGRVAQFYGKKSVKLVNISKE